MSPASRALGGVPRPGPVAANVMPLFRSILRWGLAVRLAVLAVVIALWPDQHALIALFACASAVYALHLRLLRPPLLTCVVLALGFEWSSIFFRLSMLFGWTAGFHLQLTVLCAMTLLFEHLALRHRVVLAVFPLVGLLATFPSFARLSPILSVSESVLIALQIFNTASSVLLSISITVYYIRSAQREKQKAEALAASRLTLVANLSHEFKTPLAAMLTAVQASAAKERDPAAYLRTLALCERNTRGLSRLVVRMLDLAGSEPDALAPQWQTVDLFDLAATSLERHAAQAEAAKVRLVLDGPLTVAADSAPPSISTDPDWLAIALDNLLSNAIRHAPAGSTVTLTLDRDPAGALRLRVTDQGPGIRPEDLPHIFEPFYRADKSRSRRDNAHGLGLSIARNMVERLGGRVSVDSTPGAGAAFTIHLPASG